jgi:hypothetical protein
LPGELGELFDKLTLILLFLPHLVNQGKFDVGGTATRVMAARYKKDKKKDG